MAEQELPGFTEKREVLFSQETTRDTLIEYGERFFTADRVYDALAFFQRAQTTDHIKMVCEKAQEGGDVPLWIQCKKLLDEVPDETEWNEIGVRAMERGCYATAREAFARSRNEENLEKVKGLMAEERGEAETEEPESPEE